MTKRVRATLTVKGDVQEAGYRALVLRQAQKLGLVGYVENLKNGNVLIVCEGEMNNINKFIESIRVEDEYIHVEHIEKSIDKATNEFSTFDVKTGDIAFEMFQGYATAGKYFRGLGKKIDCVGAKVDALGAKVDALGAKVDAVGTKVDAVGTKVDAVGTKVDAVGTKVDTVGAKVDAVGVKVDAVGAEVKALRAETADNFKDLGRKYHTISGDLKALQKDIHRLVDYIGMFVEEKRKSKH